MSSFADTNAGGVRSRFSTAVENRDLTPSAGRAELTFERRAGRTVLAHSRVTAPMMVIRPFPLRDGRQLVQLITLGPGCCGGDRIAIRINVGAGAGALVTTTAATRVMSMNDGVHAQQDVVIDAAEGATVEYYPAVTIPFPASAFRQTVRVAAASGARVGVMEIWALGRTARDEYLAFRALSSRTTLHVAGALRYADATELRPDAFRLCGAGVLAGRRYLASGFWWGVTLDERPRDGAERGDLLLAFAQSSPSLAYLRALGSDAPPLESALRRVTSRIADLWGLTPVSLDRFRC